MHLRPDSKLALVGAGLTAVGTVCPIITLPLIGSINYLAGGKGDGIFILAAALIGAVGAGLGAVWVAPLVGLGLIIFLLSRLGTFLSLIEQSTSEVVEASQGGPFSEMAKLFASSVSLEWGWIVLFAGVLLMIWSGADPVIKWVIGKNRQTNDSLRPAQRSGEENSSAAGHLTVPGSDSYDLAISEALRLRASGSHSGRLTGAPPKAVFGKRMVK